MKFSLLVSLLGVARSNDLFLSLYDDDDINMIATNKVGNKLCQPVVDGVVYDLVSKWDNGLRDATKHETIDIDVSAT